MELVNKLRPSLYRLTRVLVFFPGGDGFRLIFSGCADQLYLVFRALKREKRKQRVKKAKPRTVSAAALSKTSPEYAIEYVKQWKERREQWKFQTLVQAWLLHNLLDHTKVRAARRCRPAPSSYRKCQIQPLEMKPSEGCRKVMSKV